MRTRAALVSIQALSAELLASAACCSSLASRAVTSVEGLGAGAPVCAHMACAKARINAAATAQVISLFPLDTEARLHLRGFACPHTATPQCTVRPFLPEIETIYRTYQVLLLKRRDDSAADQNLNCTSSCMRRGGWAATGLPNKGDEMVPM